MGKWKQGEEGGKADSDRIWAKSELGISGLPGDQSEGRGGPRVKKKEAATKGKKGKVVGERFLGVRRRTTLAATENRSGGRNR